MRARTFFLSDVSGHSRITYREILHCVRLLVARKPSRIWKRFAITSTYRRQNSLFYQRRQRF